VGKKARAERTFKQIVAAYMAKFELNADVVCRRIPSREIPKGSLTIVKYYNQIFVPSCKDLIHELLPSM
jgi:hypothetical protein